LAVPKPAQAALETLHKPEPNPVESGDLIRRAQNGDRSAFRELYLRHHEQIYRFIWSRVHDPAQADDLTGEVFLRMVASFSGYQDRLLPFRAWLYRIARNLIIDAYRKEQHRAAVPLEDAAADLVEAETPETLAERALIFERVKQALERLALDQREIIELRFLAGLSLQEVAFTVDKSVLAVKGLQHRGLESLRDTLKDYRQSSHG
jgi:RNA polymerase sigma-70 factor (ECF subfamily)